MRGSGVQKCVHTASQLRHAVCRCDLQCRHHSFRDRRCGGTTLGDDTLPDGGSETAGGQRVPATMACSRVSRRDAFHQVKALVYLAYSGIGGQHANRHREL